MQNENANDCGFLRVIENLIVACQRYHPLSTTLLNDGEQNSEFGRWTKNTMNLCYDKSVCMACAKICVVK